MQGIPIRLKSKVWCLLAESNELKESSSLSYEDLLNKGESEDAIWIKKDIPRVVEGISNDVLRSQIEASLHNVLNAYCWYDSEIGYACGIPYIAMNLVFHVAEEDAFWILVRLLSGNNKYNLRNLYSYKRPLLQETFWIFDQLLMHELPSLAKHLERELVQSPMYATWWLTVLFSNSFPLPIISQVWDLYLLKGYTIIYSVALSTLKLIQNDLKQMRFEGVLQLLLRDSLSEIVENNKFSEIIKCKVGSKQVSKLSQMHKANTTS